ncbi:MAG: MBL fold metallo-hydrolase [Aigarchaeota archaeon]|nr:MBL fold metallo-hydrolase [Aigarchaeota archaeon]MCX8192210.1 MBL fold metallo-hydrolase [Nitrososphaeria archaeon]MDW7986182.1 MBL fold metallo-hydrolase [Nitrososphaerota archaeon]
MGLEINLIAFDSLGTRSMATSIETNSARIMIDPSAALGPKRYGLQPHPLEYQKLREHKKAISEIVKESDLVIVTHYHYDHIPRPSEDIDWLAGKKLLIKDPHHMINYSQRMRASTFIESLKKIDAKFEVADGREFKIESCRLKFSNPVQHGNDSKLGYVLEVLIEENGEKIIHTSDVEGIIVEEQIMFILSNMPDIVICDGPMTYMLGNSFSQIDLDKSIKNLKRAIKRTNMHTLILDHHLTRDREWRSKLKDFLEEVRDMVNICTAASYMGVDEQPLESIRDILWRTHNVKNER